MNKLSKKYFKQSQCIFKKARAYNHTYAHIKNNMKKHFITAQNKCIAIHK